jgi:hypothetical protein
MNITTMGIDLAKSVFQVHGVDARTVRTSWCGSRAVIGRMGKASGSGGALAMSRRSRGKHG